MTTHTTVPPEAPVAEQRINGPGSQLRQARLDLKLAPEDVAHILHLSPRQIVALENDDYTSLAGPTYVRGYLRGYAQLLGLSADPIVESYNRSVAKKKPVDLAKLAPKPEIRSDHQLIKFATLGVVMVVLGLSAVWWQEQDRSTESPAPLPTTPQAAEESKLSEEMLSAEAARIEAPAVIPEIAKTAPPVVKAPEPAAVAPPENRPSPPVATGPRGRLKLQATLDSWADVRDANGERLLYETVTAGRTVDIEGVTPFSVFLGNVEGLRIEFNDQPFDAQRYRRGDIARFTVGETARTP